MRFSKTFGALALVAAVYAAPANNEKGNQGKGAKTNTAAASKGSTAAASQNAGSGNVDTGSVTQPPTNANVDDASPTLLANAIQTASQNTGQFGVAAEAGQALSLVSKNNFINFCAGQTLTNGAQFLDGSCNGIPMGQIPKKSNMASTVITFPTTGGKAIASGTTFNVTVKMIGILAGFFTDANTDYYLAPQGLDAATGQVIGHTHITIQDMGPNMNPTTPLDPTVFAFFKGINAGPDANGVLTATVNDGLPAGNYRVCTIGAAANHQPALMPVAQRGTVDDCTKFVVSGNGKTANVASNAGSGGIAAAANAALGVQALTDKGVAASASAAVVAAAQGTTAAAVSTAAADGKGGKKAKGGAASATSTAAVAESSAAGKGNGGKKAKGGASATSTEVKATAAAAAGKGGKKGAATAVEATSAAAAAKGGKKGAATAAAPAATKAGSGKGAPGKNASPKGSEGGRRRHRRSAAEFVV